MKSKKYIALALMVFISIFSVAALCNTCSLSSITDNLSQDEQTGEQESDNRGSGQEEIEVTEESQQPEEDLIALQSSGSAADQDEQVSEQDTDAGGQEEIEVTEESQQSEEDKKAPTIELIVYQGPVYSEEDDVYYYRVEAKVTGNPQPEVDFSKDDSNGSWGPTKVQINLKRGQSYTLTATAKNSEGQATDSIDFSFEAAEQGISDPANNDQQNTGNIENSNSGDEGNEPADASRDMAPGENDSFEPDNAGHPVEIEFEKLFCGWIADNHDMMGEGAVRLGDNENNNNIRGFLNFDISPVMGKEIIDASIEFKSYLEFGNPLAFLDIVSVRTVHWSRTIKPDTSVYDTLGTELGSYYYPTFKCSTNKLLDSLRQSVDSEKQVFQLMLKNMGSGTDNDGVAEYLQYPEEAIVFKATYIP
jgi:hypothetical protein